MPFSPRVIFISCPPIIKILFVSEKGEFMSKSVILTHADCDGMCAGAVALSRFPEAEVFFTKPVSFRHDFSGMEAAEKIVICDIAMTRKDLRDIISLFEEKSKEAEIYYFDHHFVPGQVKDSLSRMLKAYVNEEASASELVYRYFQKEIPRERVWPAIYGAIGDYSQHTPFVEERIKNWDARALYFEASAIVLGIKDRKFDNYNAKRTIVQTLAAGNNPSDVPGLIASARKVVNAEFDLYEVVKQHAQKSGGVGFVKDLAFFGFRGPSALFASTVTNTRIGMAFHTRGGYLDVTIRSNDYSLPLNTVAEDAGEKVGGSGGGHPHASGARIPLEAFHEFLMEVNRMLDKYPEKDAAGPQ